MTVRFARAGFPYEAMFDKGDILERLDIAVHWGHYEIRVLRFHLTSFEPGRIINFHNHSTYEFHFIPRGAGRVILGDQPHSLSEGLLYLTGPGVMHYQEADGAQAMDELCLHVDIVRRPNPSVDPWEAAEAEECMQKLNALPLRPAADSHGAMPCFLQAYEACESKRIGYYTDIRMQVIGILLKTIQAYDSGDTGTEAPSRDMAAYRYDYAVRYMEANYTSGLRLEDVAEKLDLSPRQLQRIFRGVDRERPFSRVLEDIRLQAVCDRLRTGSLSIERIAELEGFSTAAYLHTVFRKRMGSSPSVYRKAKQSELHRHPADTPPGQIDHSPNEVNIYEPNV
ncbi:helix-turn-helix domain-containing protein [Saccharibacillus brassicae]|uniref:Helix-turn-helix domain-containing protein n=1 Tax=Saccharibacillus brassicae TaxID=2583377 RepID=A0A4Y6UTC2_SACBS|nr:helix-turn-helix domain-containing protein [Saccharibacillus brassicae]QDH20000.1 helix-turn-helix domain-containing protein [Saccharibacillus brassicae]